MVTGVLCLWPRAALTCEIHGKYIIMIRTLINQRFSKTELAPTSFNVKKKKAKKFVMDVLLYFKCTFEYCETIVTTFRLKLYWLECNTSHSHEV